MLNIKFYLDSKYDKNFYRPIHLVIRNKDKQIKVAIGEKIKKKDWNAKNQTAKTSHYNHKFLNNYIKFLKEEVENYCSNSLRSAMTDRKIKEKISSLVNSHKANSDTIIMAEDATSWGKQKVTFIDLFAGAGGFVKVFCQ